MHYNTPAAIVLACAALWFVIWACARNSEAFFVVVCIMVPLGVLGGCTGAVFWMVQRTQNDQRCAAGLDTCKPGQYDIHPALPWVIPLAMTGFLAIKANSERWDEFATTVLANDKQVPSLFYGAALILRMQIVIVGFIAMSAFCGLYPDSRGVGSMILIFVPLMMAFIGTPSLAALLGPILRIEQLGKLQKFSGWIYAFAPIPIGFLVFMMQPATRFFDGVQSHSYDPRYAALVALFGLIAVYAIFGELLAKTLHTDIEQLTFLTTNWGGQGEIDPPKVRSRLRRLKRSSHAIAVITSGIALGFLPQTLHLSDVFGMIIGVGFVSLISYIDAEMSSRLLD